MISGSPMYSISYSKPERLVRLTWLAGTAGMTDQDFKETLEAFAESALQHRAQRLIIDVREFKHRPSPEVLAWRDDVQVPKYNRAGVKKIAMVWPGTTPSSGPTSKSDKFENRYFATEAEALAWLTS
jgi:stage II sporulation SpoAA-like protein